MSLYEIHVTVMVTVTVAVAAMVTAAFINK